MYGYWFCSIFLSQRNLSKKIGRLLLKMTKITKFFLTVSKTEYSMRFCCT